MNILHKILTLTIRALILMLAYNFVISTLSSNNVIVNLVPIDYHLAFIISVGVEVIRMVNRFIVNKTKNRT